MSENEPSPTSQEDQAPQKKRKVTWRVKLGLLEILERKRVCDRVDYKAVSRRHNVSEGGLRSVYCRYMKGEIDLGMPDTPQEVEISLRMQHERTMGLLKRYHALVLDGMESLVLMSEDEMSHGKKMAWKTNGLPPTINELKKCMELRKLAEQGYNAILEEEMMKRRGEEKALSGSVIPPETRLALVTANDEERGLHALTAGGA
jgi:hypothetical protein